MSYKYKQGLYSMTIPVGHSSPPPLFKPTGDQEKTPEAKRRVNCSPVQLIFDLDGQSDSMNVLLITKIFAAYHRVNNDDWLAAVHTYRNINPEKYSSCIHEFFNEAKEVRIAKAKDLIDKDPRFIELKLIFRDMRNQLARH